jgi:hypothetical protein
MSTRKLIISFKVRADIKEGLQKLAIQDKRSLSQYIEIVLDAHLQSAKKRVDKRK